MNRSFFILIDFDGKIQSINQQNVLKLKRFEMKLEIFLKDKY